MKRILFLLVFVQTVAAEPIFRLCFNAFSDKASYITSKSSKRGVIYLNTVEELSTTVGLSDLLAIVKDSLRGGIFHYSIEAHTADSGTIFPALDSGGYWIRAYEKSQGYNVDWFGAKGNGVYYDDSCIQFAINAADTGSTVYLRPMESI